MTIVIFEVDYELEVIPQKNAVRFQTAFPSICTKGVTLFQLLFHFYFSESFYNVAHLDIVVIFHL